MPETSSPATYESLGGRPFAFYPAIRNIEHNEWTCVRETWSEVLVANAKTGAEVWIARNFLGSVSSTDQPVAILGLSRELEYKAGSVWPYNPPVLEMPAPPRVSPGTPHAAPVDAPPSAPAPRSTESQMGRLILYAVLVGFGFCLLAVLVAREGMPNPRDWLRRRDTATSDQQYLSITREDDRYSILRKLGPPEREQWITSEPAEIQFELFWYPQRSYIIVLMGSDRNAARYIGAVHATSRAVLDTVPLPGRLDGLHAPDTAQILRTHMKTLLTRAAWIAVAAVGALALGGVALQRGEHINSFWLVLAAGCLYLTGFRFYGKFLAAKVMALDDTRATPAERLNNGRDFVPTNRWIVLGHHFAAIAGPGPLVGPVLAAQFGYLPGVLWVVIGGVMAGAVQDFVILCASLRRDGKSLGQMARDEIGPLGGGTALISVIMIMIILLAVVALVVVNALKGSPWGTFTIAATMPIAVFMGLYLRYWRPGKVLEISAIGFVLVMLSILGGRMVAESATLAPIFTLGAIPLALAIIVYGFLASALPVWLLLAPRDYLSTFVKLGTIGLLAVGILVLHPQLEMPAFTRFTDGTGPIFAGKVFPFCFITIACGAISGFHALISSGTTPKLIAKEWHAWPVGYGAMLMESFVAIMAIIAASVMSPGVYFAVNAPAGIVGASPAAAAQTITSWGFPVTAPEMQVLAQRVGEATLFNRTGGAPSFALGMAHIFSSSGASGMAMGIWYHFAIMFEALFILTILDAGTRCGRFMLQDLLGHMWAPLGRISWYPSIVATSAAVVLAWGYFLYQGVIDPLGGINSLWALFGISNQLLATIALCVATTILIKMHGARYMWVTCVPLAWLLTVTMTASYYKVFSPVPRIGFLADANILADRLAAGQIPAARVAETQTLIFNNRLDAAICGIFALMVIVIVTDSIRVWVGILRGTRDARSYETPFVASQLRAEEV